MGHVLGVECLVLCVYVRWCGHVSFVRCYVFSVKYFVQLVCHIDGV